MAGELLLGIDVGTSGTKAVAVDHEGGVAGRALESYDFKIPRPGWSEQDPELWWRAAREAVSRLGEEVDLSAVRAIGLSGQMHGLVALDGAGEVVRPAILWNDQRSSAQAEAAVARAGGLEGLLALTNNRMLPGYTATKLMWLRDEERESFERTRHCLNPKDWLRFKLTAERATDVSEASGTGLFDVRRRAWSTELMAALDLDPGQWPRAFESHEVTGSLTAKAAEALGLSAGVPVMAGGGDAVIQTTGTGVIGPGSAQTTIGTAGISAAALDACPHNPEGRLQLFCNNAPGRWHAMGVAQSGGAALGWARKLLALDKRSWSGVSELAAEAPPGSEGLLFVPYLQGERCPHPDPDARGLLLGLTLRHGPSHALRAVMEGVTFALKDMLELMGPLGLSFDEVRASGGGAASALWRQIQADVFDKPVVTVQGAAEGGAYGAALLAGVGSGAWPDLDAAVAGLKTTSRTDPKPSNVRTYAKLFEVYRSMYPTLRGDMHKLARVTAGAGA